MTDFDADVIIAGAGSAGCVLAARLSENPGRNVLLVEAGGRGGGLLVNMPAGSFALMGHRKADWRYQTEPDPSINNRVIPWSGGRMLGGSSAINGMVYIRGQRQDYDRWVQAGAAGWCWNDVLPYFMKAEQFEGPPSQFHGAHGPLKVSPGGARHGLVDAVMESFIAAGIPRIDEFCGGDQNGVFETLTTTRGGKRASTANTYLAAARNRPNLRIITGALVDRVIVQNGEAAGIRIIRGGLVQDLRAPETIISAGAIGSPAILLRSGIGPADQLRSHGIAVVSDLPVGKNLQDHNGITISKLVDIPTYNSPFGAFTIAKNLALWLLKKQGPMASAAVHAMASAKSSPGLDEPDITISFIPLAIEFTRGKPSMHKQPGITIGASCMRPFSRGEIRLRDTNPHNSPVIDHRLLGDERDVEILIHAGRLIARVFSLPPLAERVTADNLPAPVPQSDKDWRDYIRATAGIGYHPVGTCPMGGQKAVLDPQLRVRGVPRLRVVDASAMPCIISGNTNAATIMIAEKAADMMNHQARTS